MARKSHTFPSKAYRPVRLADQSTELCYALLVQAARQLRRRFRHDRRILNVGFGYKIRAGRLTDTLCMRVYVPRKLQRPGPDRAIPAHVQFRIQWRRRRYRFELPTDVVAVPNFKDLTTQARLAPSAWNAADPDEYGSATALVTDGAQDYILSAAHVVARATQVSQAVPGEAVEADGGIAVGRLVAAPVVCESGIDAAVVSIDVPDPDRLVPRPAHTPVVNICPVEDVPALPRDGFRLFSFRKARSMTFHAIIPDFRVEGVYACGAVRFPVLLEFEAGTSGGDSGAMVVDAFGRAVGMHILGVGGPTSFGYALPIRPILDGVLRPRGLALVY